MPTGHSSPAPLHDSTPGRPALPGTDPSATAPAMAVGSALPGGPSTGPLTPVQTEGSSTGGGLRAALAERLAKAKAKSMTSQSQPAAATAPVATRNGAPTGLTGPSGPAAPVSAAAHGPGLPPAVAPRPATGTSNGHAPATPATPATPPVGATPSLSPFASPPLVPGGPAPVAMPPGLGAAGVVGQGGPVVAGAAAGVAAAGVAAASSATVTSATSTIGGAPTTVLPAVPPPPARAAKSARPPRKPRRTTPPGPPRRGPGVRKAHLKLTRIDPWTVMKISFMLAIAFGIMTVVSVFVIWSMLDTAGVFTAISESVNSVTGDSGDGGVDIMEWVALNRVLGFATLLAVVDVVLITALSTLFAFLYNLASTLLGGVEVTLVEDQR